MQQSHKNVLKLHPENPWFLWVAVVGLIAGALLIVSYFRTATFCGRGAGEAYGDMLAIQLKSIIHYATSRIIPQQSFEEISVSLNVLQSLGGVSNFLVFGLGHDSLMWASINPSGKTIFLEEDPKWVQTVLKDAPELHAYTVKYRTQLSEADQLLQHYRNEPDCAAHKAFIRGNSKCRLALNMLSDEIYDTEWDMIMVDAPRGYFAEAPGRMAAIYSAAVMARNRKSPGVTHVFLHDVDRRVEQLYAEAFLCKKNLIKAEGRLWHFKIPPATHGDNEFC